MEMVVVMVLVVVIAKSSSSTALIVVVVVKIVVVVSAYNEKETHKILSQNTAVHLTGDEDEMSELVQQSQLNAAAAGKVVVE